jgi:Kef-type K+ transport system membrane component KefB
VTVYFVGPVANWPHENIARAQIAMSTTAAPPPVVRPFTWGAVVVYALLLAAGVGLFLLIDAAGATLPAPAAAVGEAVAPAANPLDILPRVLLALAAILVTGRLLGWVFAYLGQPPVIGEVVAGIALGPSLLGRVAPDAMTFLVAPVALPYLGVLAQIGVIFYMFLVGLELNAARLKGQASAAVGIAHVSILAPFVLGAALALWLYPRYGPAGRSFTGFALFLGAAMAVTAFPVMARILTDRGLSRTPLGTLALSCAAADDVTAWCLLAVVVGVTQAHLGSALLVTGLAVAFIAFMFLAVRPLAARLTARLEDRPVTSGHVAAVFLAVLLAALATEAIGVHAIFGAFLLGAVIPSDSALARACHRKLDDVVTQLLLPAFFAYTGMKTQIGLVDGWEAWLAVGLIILVATAGKFGGSVAAARLTGLDWRTAAAVGALMNTRGLMGLIVLNVGLGLGVITPTLYAMMVLMALATTVLAAPVLGVLYRNNAESGARDG